MPNLPIRDPAADPSPAGEVDVLIVEDERVARKALSSLLAASGYKAEAVGSAEEALRLVKQGPLPVIAVVDLNLPGMNGLDLIRRLEQLDPSVFPILITSAGPEVVRSDSVGRDVAYVQKPVDFNYLLSLMHERPMRN